VHLLNMLGFKRENCLSLGWVAIALLFLPGCAPAQQTVSCDPPRSSENPILAIGPKTDAVKISISIDGTPSMQGFVNSLPSSAYLRTLQLIDSVSSTAWVGAPSQIKYYRFGTTRQALDRATYRRAQLPEFYGASAEMGVSNINLAINPPQKETLEVIITDLYQKNADISLVQNQLNQSYLQKGYAVGVLGIKSEFKGTIYDVGIRGQKFQYSTAGLDANQFHPFYVVLLGSYGNINHFFEQLQKNDPELIQKAEFSIFYPQPVSQVAFLESPTAPKQLPKNYKRSKALNDGSVLIKVKNDQPVELLTLNKGAQPSTLEYRLPYYPLSHLPILDASQINLQITTEKLTPKSKSFQAIKSKVMAWENWRIDPKLIQFSAKINPPDLDPGIYRTVVNVHPTDFILPDWWQNWSSREGNLDGSRTHNLLPFLKDLQSSTTALMTAHKPTIAHLCYVLQKK
jgi:hypothetical protein